MSGVEFLPQWYVRKRRRRARLTLAAVLLIVPVVGLAAWLWLV